MNLVKIFFVFPVLLIFNLIFLPKPAVASELSFLTLKNPGLTFLNPLNLSLNRSGGLQFHTDLNFGDPEPIYVSASTFSLNPPQLVNPLSDIDPTPTPTIIPEVTETPKPLPTIIPKPKISPIPTVTKSEEPTLTPPPTGGPTKAPTQIQSSTGLNADKLFEMSNNYRVSKGLAIFEKDERACKLASSRAPEIGAEINGGYMHKGLKDRKLDYWNSENIITMRTEEAAFNWWVNDYIHRVQLEGDYKYSCVACFNNDCAQEFTNFQSKN